MIVKCEQCATRFKIPDDKVPDKGVKVRCTKCQHTFRVKRDGSIVAAGVTNTQTLPAIQMAPMSATTGPVQIQIAAPAAAPPAPAVTFQAAAAPGFSAPDPFAAPSEAGSVAGEPTSDPFAFFGIEGGDANMAPAVGGAEFGAPAGQETDFFGGGGADQDPAADLFGVNAADPAPHAGGFAFAAPAAPPAVSLVSAAPQHDAVTVKKAPSVRMAPVSDFDVDAEPPTKVGYSGVSSQLAESLFGSSLDEGETAQQSANAPVDGGADGLLGEVPALDDVSGVSAAIPGAEESRSFAHDDFRSIDTVAGVSVAVDEVPAANTSVARISLKQVPVDQAGQVVEAPPPEVIAPAPSNARGLVGRIVATAALLIFLAGASVIYLNDGRLAFGADSVKAVSERLFPGGDILTFDLSNGLYKTRGDRPIFYVRGIVKNRSTDAKVVKVRAELFEDGRLVRSEDAIAGAPPTPEEVFGIGVEDDLLKLRDELARKVVPVAPGAEAPFVVAFYEYPPSLAGLRVRVTGETSDAAAAGSP